MAGASPDAPYFMTKLYTAGQIGKKYKVSLKKVYKWKLELYKVSKLHGDRGLGIIEISGDPYSRCGIPEKLVQLFPNVPSKEHIEDFLK